MIHHIFTANGAMTSPLLNIKACIMLLVSGLSQGPFLPPEIRPSNHWQIHADEKVGAVVAHVNVRDAQREGVVLTIQKSSGHHSVFSDTAINPFGEDGSSYFRVVNAGQGGVVRVTPLVLLWEGHHSMSCGHEVGVLELGAHKGPASTPGPRSPFSSTAHPSTGPSLSSCAQTGGPCQRMWAGTPSRPAGTPQLCT